MSSQPPLTRSTQKIFPFFFLSLSLVKTGAGTVAASSFSWYNTVLRERTDPPLIIIHFLFCFFLYIFRLDLSSFFFVSSLSGDFKPSSPFCERAHHFLKVTFSLSLSFLRAAASTTQGTTTTTTRVQLFAVVCGRRPTLGRARSGNERV